MVTAGTALRWAGRKQRADSCLPQASPSLTQHCHLPNGFTPGRDPPVRRSGVYFAKENQMEEG